VHSQTLKLKSITMRPILIIVLTVLLCSTLAACDEGPEDGRLVVVATTNVVGDLVRTIGGDEIALTVLMGPGVDPHLYRASEGDAARMSQADVIFYNGHNLEGRMTELFEQMGGRGVRTVPLAETLPDSLLQTSADYPGNRDPHVWLDASLWMKAADAVEEALAAANPQQAARYAERTATYREELQQTHRYVQERAQEVPEERRVLITSHDAFGYFGAAYGFEVRGLQGISTASEAGTRDVQQMAEFIVEREIPVLFAESSVPQRGMEAVRRAAQDRGFPATFGGTLYGDALGDRGTPVGTYTGMMRHNIDIIVDGLLRDPA